MLTGDGEIARDLTNNGIVRPGGGNIADLTIGGKYTQSGANSALQLNFNTQGNSKLIAQSYDIQGGKLEYIPLQGQFYAANRQIVINLGGLQNSLSNFTSVSVVSNNAMDFILDKSTNIDINNPNTTQENRQSAVPPPSQNNGSSQQPPQVQPNHPNIIANGQIRQNAYEEQGQADIASAIRDIRSSQNLNQAYQQYFGRLDNADKGTYANMLKSIAPENHLQTTAQLITTQYRSTQTNMLFALNPFAFSNLMVANTLREPIYVATGMSDIGGLNNIINDAKEDSKLNAFYFTPSYKKIDGDGYGFDMGISTAINDRQNLALSVNYQKSDLDFSGAEFDSKYFNIAVNHSIDFDSFKILRGASVSRGDTDLERTLYASNARLEGSYKNTFASAQVGIAKDYKLDNLTLTPLAYFNYNFIHQNSFSENGDVFTREFDAINHHTTSASIGANAAYILKNMSNVTHFNAYAIYEHRLSGKNFKNKAKFINFSDKSFTQRYKLNENVFTIGANTQVDFNNAFFVRLGVSSEFSKDEKNFSVLGTLGYKF